MTQALVVHGIYRHYKGDYYIVEGEGIHSETDEELVIYRGLYHGNKHGGQFNLCVRPKTMFLEELDAAMAQEYGQKHRFELQEIKSVAGH